LRIASWGKVVTMAGVPAWWENNNKIGNQEGLIMRRPAENLGRGMGRGYARGIPVHAGRFE